MLLQHGHVLLPDLNWLDALLSGRAPDPALADPGRAYVCSGLSGVLSKWALESPSVRIGALNCVAHMPIAEPATSVAMWTSR